MTMKVSCAVLLSLLAACEVRGLVRPEGLIRRRSTGVKDLRRQPHYISTARRVTSPASSSSDDDIKRRRRRSNWWVKEEKVEEVVKEPDFQTKIASMLPEEEDRAKYVALFAILAVAAATFGGSFDLPSFDLDAVLTQLTARVEELGPLGVVYFCFVYVLCELLALPAVPLTASAGYLFGALQGTGVVLVSGTLAAGISFTVGRTLLRPWVESIARESTQFASIDRAVAREGFKIVLLLRLSPIFPFALSNYLYGLTAVEFGPYLAATMLGFAPGTFLYVYGGEFASVLRAGDGADVLPWYVYAGVLAFGASATAFAAKVATQALEEAGGIEPDEKPSSKRK